MPLVWLTESCMHRQGRPWYVPDWDADFRLYPMLALRISRLGKGMPARFAGRYVDAGALWLHARGEQTLAALREQGLPWGSAVAFDSSVLVSPWEAGSLPDLAARTWGGEFRLLPHLHPDSIIEELGRCNTLRTGDVVLLPLSDTPFRAIAGEDIHIGEHMFAIK